VKASFSFVLLLFGCLWLPAAEALPPKPASYFNDYARVVPAAKAGHFNRQLEEFERATSSQIVVAVFPKLQTASSLEDFTHRVATAWKVGQQDKNNGAVLFVFIQDRKMRIEVGYGLEGALPDAICKRIIAEEITPHFRQQDYAGGLGAGINAMIAATKGEYRVTGRTVAERNRGNQLGPSGWIVLPIFLPMVIFLIRLVRRASRGFVYSGRGYRSSGWSGWGWGGGGGSWSGGGSSSWGGGGFSGGGGSFGGGGASGNW
jgi:uncharacterized protein